MTAAAAGAAAGAALGAAAAGNGEGSGSGAGGGGLERTYWSRELAEARVVRLEAALDCQLGHRAEAEDAHVDLDAVDVAARRRRALLEPAAAAHADPILEHRRRRVKLGGWRGRSGRRTTRCG